MSEIINNAINVIRSSVPETSRLSNDLIFGLTCYKYFYNEGNFDKSDYKSSYTDGQNDGGVDLIAVNETELSKKMVLIQSKNVQNFHSKDEVKDIFTKMSQTVTDFKSEKIGSYNDRIRRIFREKYDDASDDENFNIELTLFLGFDKDDAYKIKILEHLSKVDALDDFEISIFYKHEIEQQIDSLEEPKRFVPSGEIKIYNEHGIIENGENGILVNISAIALREMYDLYKDKGLFEQNFRYFIRNKKIDSQINESLSSKRDMFWFLNNGIIIGCKDFRIDGYKVKLDEFSIVNGCQTTTILGEYKGPNEDLDFPIPCKIVKPKKQGEDNFNIFISQIAEASNSQKPISERDLKSNLPEQRQLQKVLKQSDPKIYLEIKRGEGILKKKNLESWQKVRNDTFGQLILSVLLQQPGTARSTKKKIFADNTIYNRIYKRKHDKATIVDLLKLSVYYDSFRTQSSLNETDSNVAKNGKFCVLGIIGFLIKHHRDEINLTFDTSSPEWVSEITADTLEGNLFDPERPDNFEKVLFSIFGQAIRTLSVLYKSRGDLETSVTNFFKTDKKYHSIILERIKSEYLLDEYEFEKINEKIDQVFS